MQVTKSQRARRATVHLAVATLGIATVGLAAAAPASAAPEDCATDDFCMYTDIDFGGDLLFSDVNDTDFPSGFCDGTLFPDKNDFNDLTSSVINNTPRNIILYADTDCQGESIIVTPNSRISWLAGFNDKASSIRF
ncbi:MAG: peptidase inhibitor family I36 protein [Dermatophilaceae bacterium]